MADQCTATAKSTGNRCTRPVTRGLTVCRFHGGRAPQVLAKARERETEKQITRALADLDAPPIADPFEALTRLAGQVVSWKDRLAARVNALTGGGCEHCGSGGDDLRYEAKGAGTEQLRSEVALFERAMDRCAAVLGMIAKLDIDKRLAAISEQQAAAVLRAVDAAVVAMQAGKTPADARQAAARELRSAA